VNIYGVTDEYNEIQDIDISGRQVFYSDGIFDVATL
jgi:hypothetical protein